MSQNPRYFSPRKGDSPRPMCPECGGIVCPKEAKPFGTPKRLFQRRLTGVYCSSDCLLNAYDRGFPIWRYTPPGLLN